MFDAINKLINDVKDPKVWVTIIICGVIAALVWGVQLNYAVVRLAEKTGSLESNVSMLVDTQKTTDVRMERITATLDAISKNIDENRNALRDIYNELLHPGKR